MTIGNTDQLGAVTLEVEGPPSALVRSGLYTMCTYHCAQARKEALQLPFLHSIEHIANAAPSNYYNTNTTGNTDQLGAVTAKSRPPSVLVRKASTS